MTRPAAYLGRAALAALAFACAGAASAQNLTLQIPAPQPLAPQPPQLPAPPLQPDPQSPFVIYPLRGGVFMITGPGGNTTVSVGPDGVMVVDPSTAEAAPGLLAQIRKLSTVPVRAVLDTNGDPDHVGGNHTIAVSGQTLEGGNTRPGVVSGSGGSPIWANEGVQQRLAALGGDPAGWPTDTYFVAHKDMFMNGEPVQLLRVPNAHTDGDSFVMFRRSDVIAAGDVFTPEQYPMIDLEHGGGVQGLIDGLNRLIDLTIPEFNLEGGTLVVPGHGRLSDEADVAEYRDMVTIVRDRIKDMMGRKMTLAQIQAAKPTMDYDPMYGSGTTFIEQVYRSLAGSASAKGAPAKGAPAKGKTS